ncbi:MAG: alpha/beta hydrolase family protein [Acidimicrobiia bacterium]|jgi:pimeloyl-ACP methyl ester carboxylesterase|nr:MAG: alpha/beta hydrolase family protein [Acidimicrobiia bacterium]
MDIHPIDRFAAVLQRSVAARVFEGGWGDPDLVGALTADVLETPATIAPVLGASRTTRGCRWVEGTFESPEWRLPESSRTARFVWARPEGGEDATVVLLSAWGEHSLVPRLRMAPRLAERGIGSIILENPLYGSRRPRSGQVITTVAEFALMGRAVVEEARALMAWVQPHGLVGVGGFSMGANTAALAGAVMPFPVAMGLLAPSHSPGPVWRDGVISGAVDIEALGDEGLDRLGDALSSVSVLRFPPPDHAKHAVIIAGRRDGYVPASTTEDLAAHWPEAEVRWKDAGHGTLIWFHRGEWLEAIVASFERLRAATG